MTIGRQIFFLRAHLILHIRSKKCVQNGHVMHRGRNSYSQIHENMN